MKMVQGARRTQVWRTVSRVSHGEGPEYAGMLTAACILCVSAAHMQGRVMFCHMEGPGRRITCGHDETHIGNLSGQTVRSVDYSFFG